MIILISGKQGSGKTTITKALIKEINGRQKGMLARNVFFAEPLYAMHDFCWGYLKDHGFEMPFKKDGYLLQMLGTEWGRATVDQDLWVKLLRRRIEKMTEMNNYLNNVFIVSDVRFENELEAFPDALRVRLECATEVRKQRAEMWRETENHPSEVSLDSKVLQGAFNLVIETDKIDIDGCVSLIMHEVLNR